MAQWIGGGDIKRMSNRGYVYQSPTITECREMGWTIIEVWRYSEYHLAEMKKWCKDNSWWQDYVWYYSSVAFKRPEDATMFRLKFA